MQEFIGTKRVLAKPMTRKEYNDYRGWELPADENGDDAGYLVEYMDGGKSNHSNHKGYISWYPCDVFKKAYQAQPEIAEKSAEDVVTEEMIEARGLTARRVSLQELHQAIKKVEILKHTSPNGNILRIAILTLDNGFTVTGRPSVAVSVENDNDEVGVKIATQNAVHEMWPFLGFRLVQQKFEGK